MNELDTFETFRPNVRPLSPEQQATMRSQLFGASDHVATTVIDHDRPLDLVTDAMHSAPRSRRSHQGLLGVAAAAIAITGIAGIWAFESNRQDRPAPAQESSASEPIEPTAATVGQTLVPDDLATLGVSLTPAGLQTDRQAERSEVQRRVYGSAADPGDPAQMVTLTYAADMNDGRVPCEFVDGASSFEIAADTGWLCQTGSTTSAGWIVDGIAVELSAGRGVSPDGLVAVARSLRAVSPPETGEGPEIDLEPDPLPSGWTTLVGTDLPFEQALLETSWLATSDGDPNDPQQLWVRSWTGDDAAVYAFAPLESQRTIVRGQPGYLYQSSQEAQNGPIEVTVTWVEGPGLVMSVSLANPSGVAADLVTNLESWRPADTATFPLANDGDATPISTEQAALIASGPAATADGRQALLPASFPRLQFPTPESVTDPVLVGAQDYPIDGGWFSFANYDQQIDWNFDGNPTREPAFSVAIFTGKQADAERAICGSPDRVVQGGRTITILDRTQDQWRFVWSETSGVLVVVDAYFKSREEAIAAIETLQPVKEVVWQKRLASIPAPEVVTDATDQDANWTLYLGAANSDYQLDPMPTSSPETPTISSSEKNNC
jgi:hypothetical protein